jgi:AcrR family transcriptional regulator
VVSGPDERLRVHRALIDLCSEGGFAAVTVERLCERSSVGRAEFDAAYESLDDCFLRSFEIELGRFKERLDPIRFGDASWRERVRLTGYELLRLFEEDRRASHFLIVEVRTAGERALLLFGAEINAMVELIDEGRAFAAESGVLTRATAEQIAGGFFNQLYSAFISGELPPGEEIIPQLMYTVVLPYLGEAAALAELEIPPPPDPSRRAGASN